MKNTFPILSRFVLPVFILLIALACSTGSYILPGFSSTSTPSSTPVPLPPTIVETIPPIGSTIPLQSILTIFFSEKMDRSSVEVGINADFPGGFLFNWVDDATLTLAPKAVLPLDKKVTFSLAGSAKSSSGLSVLEPISFSFNTPGQFNVSQILPAAETGDVSPNSAVVVSFNQAVVPLGAAPGSLPAGFTLEPAAAGKGEWLNTSTYIFHAEPALAGGIKYTVRVNPQLTSTYGAALKGDDPNNSWSFSTSMPAVTGVSTDTTHSTADPECDPLPTSPIFGNQNGGGAGNNPALINLDPSLQINFNQSMDKSSVESNFSFTQGVNQPTPGTFTWNEKFSQVSFKPSALLQRQTQYNLTIGAQSKSKGGAALGNDWQTVFCTAPRFGVHTTSFPTGNTRPERLGVVLNITAPLAGYTQVELETLISVSPQVPDYNLYVLGTELNINGNFAPGQTYTVTLSSELKDRWQQALGQDFTFTFTEPDASPSLAMGSYVPVLFTRPEEPGISIQAVNIHNLEITQGSMPLTDFFQFQADYNFEQNYQPTDQRTWSINPNLPRNENKPINIPLSASSLIPGLYFVKASSPELPQYNTPLTRALIVSNINITIQSSPSEVMAWAVDLRSQTPVQNAPVNVYNADNKHIASGITDSHGLFRQSRIVTTDTQNEELFAILGKPGDDLFGMAAPSWNQGVSPWVFGMRTDFSGTRQQVYLYTDRPIYRPGDTVHYRGILKNWYDGRYTDASGTVDLKNFNIDWSGPNGKLTQPKIVTVSSFGTFTGEYTLKANAVPGDYSLTVANGFQAPGEPFGAHSLYGDSLNFKVADYRKPEINLSVEMTPNPAKSGTKINAQVKAEYFFGSAVPDLLVKWSLYSQPGNFPISDYSTGIQTTRWQSSSGAGQFGNIYLNGEGKTDANGTLNIPLNNLRFDDTANVTLEITASESGGFPVSARTNITIHPDDFYIGVRPQAWVGRAGSALGFDLLSVDWDRQPVSKTIQAAFNKVRWDRTDGNFGEYSFTQIYTLVDQKTINTGADGTTNISFTPKDAGTYVLDVTSGKAHTQTLLWVSGGENAQWPNLPFQQIQLTADHEQYKPGDTAKIFIPNPFNAPVLTLLTTARSTFKTVEVVTVPAQGWTYEVPLSNESAPNIYLSATMLGAQGVDFRQGYINLPVEPGAFTLNVALQATPAKARPGDHVQFDLTVTDSKGKPVQGEFSLAVVDLAALALADPNSVDILPAFYDIQPLGVTTGLTAAVYEGRLFNYGGGKGGGGGDGIVTIRSKFPDTAYWKADIVTDTAGKAVISLTLPDNLSTWQVDTRGLSKDTKVGQARVKLVTSKEVLIRPQTPRFLVAGDHAELAAMLNNNTNQAMDAVVSLKADGLTLDDPRAGLEPAPTAEQTVHLPANGSARVSWSGLVENITSIDPVFTVSAGSYQDASRATDGAIPVIHYTSPQTFSTAGTLTGTSTRQEIIAVPRSFQPLGGDLEVELSPSLAVVILDSLKAADSVDKPWSSEQVLSTLLPNIATYRALKAAGVDDPTLTARLQANLVDDLHLLATFRGEDGGWRWTNSSTKSDPYLTAYGLLSYQQILDSGLKVEGIDLAQELQTGREGLSHITEPFMGKVETSAWLDGTGNANRACFYLYALEQTGGFEGPLMWDGVPNLVELLIERKDRLDPWAQAMLAQAIKLSTPGDPRVNTLISDLQSSAIRSSSGAHWESLSGDLINPGSPIFNTAVVVNALSAVSDNSASGSVNPLLADAIRYLASQRDSSGRWSSPFETAWVITSLAQTLKASGDLQGSYAFSAQLNDTALAQGSAAQGMNTVIANVPLANINLSGANSLLINKLNDSGTLYYRAALTIDRPAESAPAVERGMTIRRQYMDCSLKPCQPVSSYQLKTNESGRVTVKLSLTLENDAYHLMVQDFIPAGTDILDTSLKTSQQGVQDQTIQTRFDPANPFSDGWGWWLFNQPQISASNILWSADYLPAGSYELTYTLVPSLAGEYRVLPAHTWEANFPEVEGSSAGEVFVIMR